MDGLIGYTGFVGGALLQQHNFPLRFNTSNASAISGQSFDTLVCAAAPGSMFIANRKPERDLEQIHALTKQLEGIKAERMVLISSIAVLADFSSGDDETTKNFQEKLAYGRHRRILEKFCETHFSNCLIVRLPALFGTGLRKNFIFDLLNPVPTMLAQERLEYLLAQLPAELCSVAARLYKTGSHGMYTVDRDALNRNAMRRELEAAVNEANMQSALFHHPETSYQYYDISRLWSDIQIAFQADLTHVHLATEPLRAGDIYQRLLGAEMPASSAPLHREDMHTRYAGLWRRSGFYLEDAGTVLGKLETFFANASAGVQG